MKRLHINRCAELYQFLLLCHVTEHTTVLTDVTPLSLTCTDISYNTLPLPAVVEDCVLSLDVKAGCVSETSAKLYTPLHTTNSAPHYTLQTLHPITHYTLCTPLHSTNSAPHYTQQTQHPLHTTNAAPHYTLQTQHPITHYKLSTPLHTTNSTPHYTLQTLHPITHYKLSTPLHTTNSVPITHYKLNTPLHTTYPITQ